jgi:hypothetical protein
MASHAPFRLASARAWNLRDGVSADRTDAFDLRQDWLAVAGIFLVIDAAFFLSNSLKIVDGGYVPLLLAAGFHRGGTLDEFERNQKRLALNNYGRAGGVKTGRGGRALLSGIMTCERCGRRLSVAYTGNPQSRPVYRCDKPFGQEKA